MIKSETDSIVQQFLSSQITQFSDTCCLPATSAKSKSVRKKNGAFIFISTLSYYKLGTAIRKDPLVENPNRKTSTFSVI